MKANPVLLVFVLLACFARNALAGLPRYSTSKVVRIIDGKNNLLCRSDGIDVICATNILGEAVSPYRIFCRVNEANGIVAEQEWIFASSADDFSHPLCNTSGYGNPNVLATDTADLANRIGGGALTITAEGLDSASVFFGFQIATNSDFAVYRKVGEDNSFCVLNQERVGNGFILLYNQGLPRELWVPKAAREWHSRPIDIDNQGGVFRRGVANYRLEGGLYKLSNIILYSGPVCPDLFDDDIELHVALQKEFSLMGRYNIKFESASNDRRENRPVTIKTKNFRMESGPYGAVNVAKVNGFCWFEVVIAVSEAEGF